MNTASPPSNGSTRFDRPRDAPHDAHGPSITWHVPQSGPMIHSFKSVMDAGPADARQLHADYDDPGRWWL